MSKTLMILFPDKEPDIKHICYLGACPLFTEPQDGLCKKLWEIPPKGKEGEIACICNYYDTMKPTIVEADGVNIEEVIRRCKNDEGNDYRIAVNDIIDYLKDIHFNEYFISITNGVGFIKFDTEKFINDLKKHFKNI